MKIIKRNGSEEVFDIRKIVIAITKADTSAEGRSLTDSQIEDIAEYVEFKCNKLNRAVSVEEIQDLVENQIMATGAFDLARRYVRYRYKRSLVRRANTTDNRILSLIECNNEDVKQENSNKNPAVNSVQRDYMAGEVSRDLTRRMLLPEDIVEADKEGYANAIFGIAASLSRGLPIDESIKLENGKYFWCSQKGLTQADIAGTDNK